MARPRPNQLEKENEALQQTLDDVYEKLQESLDPALSREEIVQKLQELEEQLSPEDEADQGTGDAGND